MRTFSGLMEASKQYHDKLAGIVKGTHAKLRHKYRTCDGDFDEIWDEHCEDEAALSQYADAMYHLANDVWTKRPQTRIHWCRDTCRHYFYEGGLLKILKKEKRQLQFEQERSTAILKQERSENAVLDPSPISPFEGVAGSAHTSPAVKTAGMNIMTNPERESRTTLEHENEGVGNQNEVGAVGEERLASSCGNHLTCVDQVDQISIIPPVCDKIRLLDVGSCYNPFEEFDEFLAVGIDISPAVDAVHRCDFVHLIADAEPILKQSDFVDFKHNLTSPVGSFPRTSFHVIVFSLLLEYFPSPVQRLVCCEKAVELLMFNGLLIVITPDSHHQNRNAPMMKSWKQAIESVGFKRCIYEKQEHLHCMAFRKVISDSRSHQTMTNWREIASLLYIPQDFTDDAITRVTSQPEGDKGSPAVTITDNEENLMEEFGDMCNCFDDL